ncbi:MAG: M48 family metallopeptidase [Armatimonadetes bacterium]|nr:M48 family metallopeptidase [Armatimonadota bacterium]
MTGAFDGLKVVVHVFGKVHDAGDGQGMLCRLDLEGLELVATQHRVEAGASPRTVRFPLRTTEISYGGTDDGKLVLKTPEHILYAERDELEPELKRLGLVSLDHVLSRERQLLGGRRRKGLAVWVAVLAGCIALAFGALWLADWAVARAVDLTPAPWEVQLGQAVLDGQTWDEVTDPEVIEPVGKITERLMAEAGEHPYDFRFKVVRDPQVNAFALPGGGVVIYTGLLENADTPEELAGVLGHEVQHVLWRHSLRGLYDRLKWHVLVAMVLGDISGAQELLLAQAAGLMQLSYGRGMEREADRRGVELLVRAKIDPQGLHDFFGKLSEQEGTPESLTLLSTHPSSRERQEYLKELIEENSGARYQPLDVDWEGLQEKLKGGAGIER